MLYNINNRTDIIELHTMIESYNGKLVNFKVYDGNKKFPARLKQIPFLFHAFRDWENVENFLDSRIPSVEKVKHQRKNKRQTYIIIFNDNSEFFNKNSDAFSLGAFKIGVPQYRMALIKIDTIVKPMIFNKINSLKYIEEERNDNYRNMTDADFYKIFQKIMKSKNECFERTKLDSYIKKCMNL